ncbi:hypothetical protein D9M68_714230 [compost metagenome]
MFVPEQETLLPTQMIPSGQRGCNAERMTNGEYIVDPHTQSVEGRLPHRHEARHTRILDAEQGPLRQQFFE